MITKFLGWLDDRTGYRDLVQEALFENIPGGARWRYVWGSTLVFCFMTQVITGIFLWMAYSPSAQSAWESVFYIQFRMQGGWFLRGIHHFTASAMVVLLALHFWQVLLEGAYRAPREVNYWLGLVLMLIVLGLSLTGYLLPWDQKGYWATKVATQIATLAPMGDQQAQVAIGGAEYGHHTLTRFFALHAGLLPGLLVVFLALHIYVFRRHGLHCKRPEGKPDGTFWPDQVLKDAVACLATLAVIIGLIVYFRGAELGAPADASRPYSAARPEWYFLFLFQFLKLFPGDKEAIGAIVVPGLILLVMALMPIFGKWKLGHYFNIAFMLILTVGAGVLTALAIRDDRSDRTYRNAVWEAEQFAFIAQEHALKNGIPPDGAQRMMQRDPRAEAFGFVARECLSCHSHSDSAGQGFRPDPNPFAPNLYRFGRREWVRGLLDPAQVDGPDYFGQTTVKAGEMVSFVKETLAKNLKPDDLDKIAIALEYEADFEDAKYDEATLTEGRRLIENNCLDCHRFQGKGETAAPDLTGWGSPKWIAGMISDPSAAGFYQHLHSDNDAQNQQKMPSYAYSSNGSPTGPPVRTPEQIAVIVEWLRGKWPREIHAGEGVDQPQPGEERIDPSAGAH